MSRLVRCCYKLSVHSLLLLLLLLLVLLLIVYYCFIITTFSIAINEALNSFCILLTADPNIKCGLQCGGMVNMLICTICNCILETCDMIFRLIKACYKLSSYLNIILFIFIHLVQML